MFTSAQLTRRRSRIQMPITRCCRCGWLRLLAVPALIRIRRRRASMLLIRLRTSLVGSSFSASVKEERTSHSDHQSDSDAYTYSDANRSAA